MFGGRFPIVNCAKTTFCVKTKKVAKILNKTLNNLFEDEVNDIDRHKTPEKFELLRQLKDLL